MYAWSSNDRHGLLRLDQGWNTDRAIWQKLQLELQAAGWKINPHDEFHAVIDGCTYYTLSLIDE